MHKILCCLNHELTAEQRAELTAMNAELYILADFAPKLAMALKNVSHDDIVDLVESLVCKCADADVVLGPVGSPAFFAAFARAWDGRLMFAESDRVSVDEPQPDGSVKKTSVFKHKRFVTIR
jgi:hypothetical protein